MFRIVKSSKELNLSFNFKIQDKIDRTLFIEVNGLFRPIIWNENSFEWLLEDLVYYMQQNKYQQRWDVTNIQISNCKSLKLNKEQFNELQKWLKCVVQWDIKLKY